MWAVCAAALWLCACSGSTAGVGVLPVDTDEQSDALEGESADGALQGSEGLPGQIAFVAGVPVDWSGPALPWPLEVPLREFFSDGSWPGPFGPPPSVERRVIAAMGRSARDGVRVVAAAPETAERLREVFVAADVQLDGEMVPRVMRDRRSDEYRVALGSASCGYASGHHGGSCAQVPAGGFEHP